MGPLRRIGPRNEGSLSEPGSGGQPRGPLSSSLMLLWAPAGSITIRGTGDRVPRQARRLVESLNSFPPILLVTKKDGLIDNSTYQTPTQLKSSACAQNPLRLLSAIRVERKPNTVKIEIACVITDSFVNRAECAVL